MIELGYQTYDARDPHDRRQLEHMRGFEPMRTRPRLTDAERRIERALWSGVDVTPAIQALDDLTGDADLEPIDEREPEEDGGGVMAEKLYRWEVCPSCGHKHPLEPLEIP